MKNYSESSLRDVHNFPNRFRSKNYSSRFDAKLPKQLLIKLIINSQLISGVGMQRNLMHIDVNVVRIFRSLIFSSSKLFFQNSKNWRNLLFRNVRQNKRCDSPFVSCWNFHRWSATKLLFFRFFGSQKTVQIFRDLNLNLWEKLRLLQELKNDANSNVISF